MLEEADALSIAVPAVRHLQKQIPEADVHVLTYGKGAELVDIALPETSVIVLPEGQWPQDIVPAMEVFLGLAERIIGEGYKQIINLDVAFMPCFLARFLQDAGEPVSGNLLGMSVAELIDELQQQTLSADFVNEPSHYVQSSWLSMNQVFSDAWLRGGNIPDGGYPEFYLRRCCGFSDIDMDMQLAVSIRDTVSADVCLYLPGHATISDILSQLKTDGITAIALSDQLSLRKMAEQIAGSSLVVCEPGTAFWLAKACGKTTLLVGGEVNPRSYMPDYATDYSTKPTDVAILVNGIKEILGGGGEA